MSLTPQQRSRIKTLLKTEIKNRENGNYIAGKNSDELTEMANIFHENIKEKRSDIFIK